MPLPALRTCLRLALLPVLLALVIAAGAAAEDAVVEVNDIRLRADGGFQPRTLPRRRYVPIQFRGHVDLSARHGRALSPLRQAVIAFDRDGRLSVGGLPVCEPAAIAAAGTREARELCGGALVGTGHLGVLVSLPGGAVRASAPLTIFNGPRLDGNPTQVFHARFTVPATETDVIVVPIERVRGAFRYRAHLDLPPLAGGLGALTHLDVRIGRRYRAGGKARSYVSARCGENILRTHGRFSFEDGTVISGEVEKYCRNR